MLEHKIMIVCHKRQLRAVYCQLKATERQMWLQSINTTALAGGMSVVNPIFYLFNPYRLSCTAIFHEQLYSVHTTIRPSYMVTQLHGSKINTN